MLSKTLQPTATLITAIAAATTTASDPNHGDENNGECQLLGPFAILVQGALGSLALLSLVYKRWRERPQRPLKIWAFDASKQVFGTVLLHLANLLMSMFSAGQLEVTLAATSKYQPNPCSFYLLNLGIDTTIGIPILIIILRLFTAAALLTPLGNPPESIESGNYGSPPKAQWWFKQSIVYFLGLLGMKSCVLLIFQLMPWIVQVGDWALRWTEGNEAIQIAFVMLIFPLIMNAFQYYIIDTFIKKRTPPDHEPLPSDDGDADDETDRPSRRQRPLLSGDDDDDSIMDSDEDVDARKKSDDPNQLLLKSGEVSKLTIEPKGVDEYNPDKDGNDTPTTGSGSNSNGEGDHPASR